MELFKKVLDSKNPEEIYENLIILGKSLPLFPSDKKNEDSLVLGCQSVMHLTYVLEGDKLYFYCDSEALISKGIAAFCIHLLNGLTAESILKHQLEEIKALNLPIILSPSRSNGLKSLLQKMKTYALKELMIKSKQ